MTAGPERESPEDVHVLVVHDNGALLKSGDWEKVAAMLRRLGQTRRGADRSE